MNKMKISLIQSDLTWEDRNVNIISFEKKILDSDKSDIFVLPEMFTTGFTNNVYNCYETWNGEVISWMKELSGKINSAICGSMIFKEFDKFYNRFIFVEPSGKIIHYDKRHLFGIGGETDIFSKGDNKVIVEYKTFRILLLTCYDLRFPVWSRNADNYDIVIYVANWPESRRYAWDILLKARAIENQCYVAGVNRVGVDGKNLKYNGGTYIIDPLGEIINSAKDNKNEVISAIVDKNRINEIRTAFPFLKDKDSFEII